jgi:hypothetical protein
LAGNLKRQKIMENDNEKMIDYLKSTFPKWRKRQSSKPTGVKFVKNIALAKKVVMDGTSK